MAFQLKTADVESALYDALDHIEILKKDIAPKLADALADKKAYDGNIELLPGAEGFRIDYRPLGGKAIGTITVKFPSAKGKDYVVTWTGPDGAELDHAQATDDSLVDIILIYIDAALSMLGER